MLKEKSQGPRCDAGKPQIGAKLALLVNIWIACGLSFHFKLTATGKVHPTDHCKPEHFSQLCDADDLMMAPRTEVVTE